MSDASEPTRTFSRVSNLLWRGLRIALGTFILSSLGACALQEALIFPAPETQRYDILPPEFEEVSLTTSDGETLYAVYAPPRAGDLSLLMFHGNGMSATGLLPFGRVLSAEGYGVLLLEYRGYPKSTGRPSEDGLYLDADAGYAFLREADARVVAYGMSLGSGVAVDLAARVPVAGLILEAPFDSLTNVAAQRVPFLPVRLLLRHRFENLDKIGGVDAPILILHGEQDRVVPIENGRTLSEAAREAEFVTFENGTHNNLLSVGGLRDVLRFLEGLESTPLE
ncbi:MAG: alpha/beta hydrolase [Pseudomonadota bacterium]